MCPERSSNGKGDVAGSLERLRRLRGQARVSPGEFHTLFDALEELAAPRGPLAWDVSHAADLHVAFRLDDGGALACVQILKGRISRHAEPEPAATLVTLSPATAKRALTGHPAGVLIEAYMKGEARVEGEVPQFLSLVSLLEALADRLARGAGP